MVKDRYFRILMDNPFRVAGEKLAEECREKDRMIADQRAEITRLKDRLYRLSSDAQTISRKAIERLGGD